MTVNLLEFSALALAHFVALLSPGPDFFLIIGHSARYGYRPTLWACSGIASANGIYILLALLGFSLLRENPLIFQTMKWLGAGYLLYLSSLLLKTQKQDLLKQPDKRDKNRLTGRQMFLRGFLSAILNPKNMVFYLSLMTLIVAPQTPLPVQAGYGLWMVLVVFSWDYLVAWGIGNRRAQELFNQHCWRIEKVSGALLMLMAIFVII